MNVSKEAHILIEEFLNNMAKLEFETYEDIGEAIVKVIEDQDGIEGAQDFVDGVYDNFNDEV